MQHEVDLGDALGFPIEQGIALGRKCRSDVVFRKRTLADEAERVEGVVTAVEPEQDGM
ncbi:MAG: hypothetical protein ACOYM2_01740 [Rectinemataceae bacterium]